MKRLLIISDTHKVIDGAERIIKNVENIDLIIHLGDHYDDALLLSKRIGIKVVAVRGNCDINREAKNDEIIEVEDHKLFLTHGHGYGVKLGLMNLYYKAVEAGCDIALFGHTHMPVKIEHEGILIMNPGSISRPRGGSEASYGIIEIDGKNMKSMIIEA